jgi:hypothetical protein
MGDWGMADVIRASSADAGKAADERSRAAPSAAARIQSIALDYREPNLLEAGGRRRGGNQ